jgi:hypothetical protein
MAYLTVFSILPVIISFVAVHTTITLFNPSCPLPSPLQSAWDTFCPVFRTLINAVIHPLWKQLFSWMGKQSFPTSLFTYHMKWLWFAYLHIYNVTQLHTVRSLRTEMILLNFQCLARSSHSVCDQYISYINKWILNLSF